MLKEGDTVTVGCSPTIKVGESFIFFKPHASVSRKLTDDVTGDLKEINEELRKRLFASLRVEIESVNSVYNALGDSDDLEALVALCEKEAGDVTAQSSFQVSGGQGLAKGKDGKGSKGSKGGISKKSKPKGGVHKKTPQG